MGGRRPPRPGRARQRRRDGGAGHALGGAGGGGAAHRRPRPPVGGQHPRGPAGARTQRGDRDRARTRGRRARRERARARARGGDRARRRRPRPEDRGRGRVRGRLGAGSGGGLRHRPQPRPAHGRRRATVLAAVGPRLPAAAERRAHDSGRAAPRGQRDGARRRRGGLPGSRAEPAHEAERMKMGSNQQSAISVQDPLRHIKPSVRSIAAYTLAVREAAVKLNQNENPYDLPEAVKRRVLDRALARPWSRYPEFDPKELVERLASVAGWKPEGVLAGNGSNELIEALLLVTVGPGTRVVIPEPTFTLYALLTKVLGGESIRVALGPELEYQAKELRRVRRELAAPLTIVCSPNNPTGGLLAADEISR